jgi:hypothetical protein
LRRRTDESVLRPVGSRANLREGEEYKIEPTSVRAVAEFSSPPISSTIVPAVSFLASSSDVKLDGITSTLSASCRNDEDVPLTVAIKLSSYIGSMNGAFNLLKIGFQARNLTYSEGWLRAKLEDSGNTWVDASLNLNICVTNDNGTLKASSPYEKQPFASYYFNSVSIGARIS